MARAFQACQKELQGTSEKAAADIGRTTMQDQVTVNRPAQNRTQEKVLFHMSIWRTGKRQEGRELYLLAVICLMPRNRKGRQGQGLCYRQYVCTYCCEVAGRLRRIPGCCRKRLPVNRQRQTLLSLWREHGFLMDATAAGFMTLLDGLMLDL